VGVICHKAGSLIQKPVQPILAKGFEDIYNKEHLPVPGTDRFISDSICYNASLIAKQASAAAIITMTHSGYTAFRVSSHRPDTNILIFTDN